MRKDECLLETGEMFGNYGGSAAKEGRRDFLYLLDYTCDVPGSYATVSPADSFALHLCVSILATSRDVGERTNDSV